MIWYQDVTISLVILTAALHSAQTQHCDLFTCPLWMRRNVISSATTNSFAKNAFLRPSASRVNMSVGRALHVECRGPCVHRQVVSESSSREIAARSHCHQAGMPAGFLAPSRTVYRQTRRGLLRRGRVTRNPPCAQTSPVAAGTVTGA